MSTISNSFGLTGDTTLAEARVTPAGGGFWVKLYKAFIAAREEQGMREANRFLARQSDRFLQDIGMSEKEIVKLRRGVA